MKTKIIFVKPTSGSHTWIAIFERDESESGVLLSRVISVPTKEDEITLILAQHQDAEVIKFDGTAYMQVGAEIRVKTDLPISIYRQKGNAFDRIRAQAEWILNNVVIHEELEKNSADYALFMRLSEDLKPESSIDTSPADLLADAARHFRRTTV
jgi:hypothetical protein